MHIQHHRPKRREEYAYVLGAPRRGRSYVARGRDGIIVTVVGERWLTLLELLGTPGSKFEAGERIYVGKDKRTKVSLVLGKISYERIPGSAKSELRTTVTKIVTNNEARFVEYLNNAGPLTSRVHALYLIPGIGKTYMNAMLDERERKKFESYHDLQERVGLKDPITHITDRIMSEMTDSNPRMNIFVKR